uniref:Outer dense fiber protein 3-like n=1 Tax=Sphaeramia orbicularis TaxID=375764 RepID=A0A673AJL1_9TELE
MTSADPWVGTWRPHRPKGPIAALHGSPGPAYALPGLTGGERHDPTKNKAPVISLGKRYELPSFNCSPGPKYLVPANVSKTGRHGTPAFSLHSRLKSPKVTFTKAKAPCFSFGLRHSEYILPVPNVAE